MSFESQTSDSAAASWRDRFGFSHLLGVTVGFVVATIVLGVGAKATGSGLACDANWPLCNGGLLNLFPANFPSFFEWIHRVVAMVAGFFIVGTAVAAWRNESVSDAITYAVTLGTVLTPVQVVLGRETVFQYDLTILSLHFWTAVLIFLLFAGAAVAVWAPRISARHVTIALGAGALLVPIHVALSPLFIGRYTAVVQALQYGITLALLLTALVSALVGPRRFADRRTIGVLVGTVVLTFAIVLLGRRAVMTFSADLDRLYLAVAGGLFGTLLLAAVLTRRLPRSTESPLGA